MDYRLYYLDSKGHFIDVQLIEAVGDLAAVVACGLALVGQSRQLWERGRQVLELPK